MEQTRENIKINLQGIKDRINEAAKKSGSYTTDITLLAVTKTYDIPTIKLALEEGLTEIGENKVQEIRDKYDLVKNEAKIHMIGHLQRNKVKYIIDKVDMIHSLDSFRLAEKINLEAKKREIIMPVLVQVNVANEESKFGLEMNEVIPLLHQIYKMEHIQVKGLMTIAPFVINPEENRPYFSKLRDLFIDIKHKNIDNIYMETLSMGMTNDYDIAIEEGSNLVRVGTGIFGKRDYSNS